MEISRINDIIEYEKLRPSWDAIYALDPYATVFVSWEWLRSFFAVTSNWLVLTLRPANHSPYVAFLPLRMKRIQKYGFNISHALHMGATPLADYAGFVCLPEYEGEAMWAFAEYVQEELSWYKFHLTDIMDQRLDSFLKYFSPKKFNIQQANGVSCPIVALPNTWDAYLEESVKPSTRQRLRRNWRMIENLDGFSETLTRVDNVDSQIETLLTLWQSRWGLKTEHTLTRYRHILRRCFEEKCLWLSVLSCAEGPIAALAAFVDERKKTFSFYIGGFNEKFRKMGPGKVIIGYSIRCAIENGFHYYDFLRGGEEYKSSWGGIERFTTTAIVSRQLLEISRTALRIKWHKYGLRG